MIPTSRAYPALVLAVLIGTAGASASQDAGLDLSSATPFLLNRGVNHIRSFDADGHEAEIVYAWRNNGNAHGYGVYSVLMPRPGTVDDWGLVTFETHNNGPNGSQIDALRDEPFDDEQSIASVRFFKAQWKGKPATLAITARRDLSKAASYIDPGPVTFSVYQLIANMEGPGWPPYYFDLVDHSTSEKSFCNSDLALTKVLGLSLPKDYQGQPRLVAVFADDVGVIVYAAIA